MYLLAPHVINGLTLGLLFALIALGFHTDRGRHGGDQPSARVIVCAGCLLRPVHHGRRTGIEGHGIRDSWWFGSARLTARYTSWRIACCALFWLRLVGMVLELLPEADLRQEAPLYGLLLTFGAALVVEEVIRLAWGTGEQSTLPLPQSVINGAVLLGEA